MTDSRDAYYMGLALEQAHQAAQAGEVPIGAVLLVPGRNGSPDTILACTHNQPIGQCDPSAHAEILALRAGAAALGNYRLDGCVLYVTLEPCAMCAQAVLHARIARVVYGAREPKSGAAGSVIDLFAHPLLNHQTQVCGGVEADACATLLQSFFANQRERARRESVPLRQDALRTAPERFMPLWKVLPVHWQFCQRWAICTQPQWAGLRLHWLDLPPTCPNEQPLVPAPVTLALHAPWAWWPQWLERARADQAAGRRVLLPDLIGCGMSDKPKKPAWHTLRRHADVLVEWLGTQTDQDLHLLLPPDMAGLGRALLEHLSPRHVTLEMVVPQEPRGLPKAWPDLPYPDAGHRGAQKAWPWPQE